MPRLGSGFLEPAEQCGMAACRIKSSRAGLEEGAGVQTGGSYALVYGKSSAGRRTF